MSKEEREIKASQNSHRRLVFFLPLFSAPTTSTFFILQKKKLFPQSPPTTAPRPPSPAASPLSARRAPTQLPLSGRKKEEQVEQEQRESNSSRNHPSESPGRLPSSPGRPGARARAPRSSGPTAPTPGLPRACRRLSTRAARGAGETRPSSTRCRRARPTSRRRCFCGASLALTSGGKPRRRVSFCLFPLFLHCENLVFVKKKWWESRRKKRVGEKVFFFVVCTLSREKHNQKTAPLSFLCGHYESELFSHHFSFVSLLKGLF